MTIDQIDNIARSGANIAAMLGNEKTAPLAQTLLAELQRHVDEGVTLARSMKAAAEARMRIEGPKLWAELHTRASAGDPVNAEDEKKWLAQFATKLPCGTCKAHFLTLVRAIFANGFDGYFEKTVEIHNLVNDRIGKPRVTLEQARTLWLANTLTPAA